MSKSALKQYIHNFEKILSVPNVDVFTTKFSWSSFSSKCSLQRLLCTAFQGTNVRDKFIGICFVSRWAKRYTLVTFARNVTFLRGTRSEHSESFDERVHDSRKYLEPIIKLKASRWGSECGWMLVVLVILHSMQTHFRYGSMCLIISPHFLLYAISFKRFEKQALLLAYEHPWREFESRTFQCAEVKKFRPRTVTFSK